MSFVKFVSLLDQRSLYFSRVDHLGDRLEGSMSRQRASLDVRINDKSQRSMSSASAQPLMRLRFPQPDGDENQRDIRLRCRPMTERPERRWSTPEKTRA
jgi:hypothetical protein